MNQNLGELLGYKLILAFEGTTPPLEILSLLSSQKVGGFTLFQPFNVKSPQQIQHLTTALQEAAKAAGEPPLLIAADQEGGQLLALGEGTTQFPGNMALGATGDPVLAEKVGYAIGQESSALGVNINYAPVCDLNTNPDNPSLGVRAFGNDPELAARLAAAMVKGLQAGGVAATLKHFPGSGAAAVDPHYQVPLIDHSLEQMEKVALPPFKAGIQAGARLVMTGHLAIPSLTGSGEMPATLSRRVSHDLLRKELGFEGVVITDAMDMGAITQGVGQIIDVVAAVRAGVDLLLLKANPEEQNRIYSGLKLALTRNLISAGNIQTSVERILALKKWVAGISQPHIDVVGCVAHQTLARQVAERSLTLVRDEVDLLPLKFGDDARIAVIMPKPKDLTPADTSSYVTPSLATALRQYHPLVDEYITRHPPTAAEIAALSEKAMDYDLLILGTINASMQPAQAKLADELLKTGVPTVTIALRTPYDLLAYPQSQTHICTYSILPPSMLALAGAFWGRTPFCGRLPVQIQGLYPSGHGIIPEGLG